jgi:hypothetical protein
MSHYAQLEATDNPNLLKVVQNVVAEADFIATGALGDPAFWMQNSYNTRGGVHYDNNGNPDAEGFRGNFAGIGYIYDKVNDVFYAPQPSPDHILDTDTWTWWNPTATDPVETKPVKATIPAPVEPVVEVPTESIIDVPAEVVKPVVEAPVEALVEPAVETPAEAVVEEVPTEAAPEEAPK